MGIMEYWNDGIVGFSKEGIHFILTIPHDPFFQYSSIPLFQIKPGL